MIALALWFYGFLVLASMIMVSAWGAATIDLAAETGSGARDLVWHKPFVIAAGLTLHAACMTIACGYRAYDVLVNGRLELGSWALLQVLILAGMSGSKAAFVWAGSINEGERLARWPWWAFLYLLVLWGVFSWMWATGFFR